MSKQHQMICARKLSLFRILFLLLVVIEVALLLILYQLLTKNSDPSKEHVEKEKIAKSIFESEYLMSKVFNKNELAKEMVGNPYFKHGEYYVLPHSFLMTIGQFVISHRSKCDANLGERFNVVVIVISAVTHFDKRENIRKTWGGYAVKKGALVLFLLAKSEDDEIQEKVFEENERYSDVIQASFIDSYNNLTLKTITLLKWMSEFCSKAKFVFKVDDDMIVNPDKLIETCNQLNVNRTIIGWLVKNGKTQRKISKYTIPHWAFTGDVMYDFVYGASNLVSVDSVSELLKQSMSLPMLHLEDIFINGIVAERANIHRVHSDMFKPFPVPLTRCTFKSFISILNYFDYDLIQLWEDAHNKDCSILPWHSAIEAAAGYLL